jgi:TolA-binding protein
MRFALTALVLLFSLLLGSAAFGQDLPQPGLLFNEADAKKLVEDERDLKELRGVVETQKAIVSTKDEQIMALQSAIKELKDAADKQATALALAEDREKRRQEIENEYKGVLAETRSLITDQREALKEVMAQNRALHRELTWTRILGPIAVIGAAVGGFLLH